MTATFDLAIDRCIQCNHCIKDCPFQCLAANEEGHPTMVGPERCIDCKHCLTVCPSGAVTINGTKPEESLPLKDAYPSPQAMEVLIKGRRSIRHFKEEALPEETLRKLFEVIHQGPTAGNQRATHFTVTTKATTDRFRKALYQGLDAFLATGALDGMPFAPMIQAINEGYKQAGADRLLCGAPHLVVVHAPKAAMVPEVDCHIALTTLDLFAPTLGVGTLWNGLLKWSLNDWVPALRQDLGIPEDHTIGYCMVVGRPSIRHHRTVQREDLKLNLV